MQGGFADVLSVSAAGGDLTQSVPVVEVAGLDISEYAIAHAHDPIRARLQVGDARALPYQDKTFDLVISINTLHNLNCRGIDLALREIERVGRRHKYICVESFRNEEE